MNLWQNYVKPKTLSETMEVFKVAPRPLVPIAGGTDLLIDLEQGRRPPVETLVDISEVLELQVLEIRGDRLFVGAGVPVDRITRHPLVGRHARALVEAGNLIAGPQVRNVATLGGNVAHALPAADGTIALLALRAEVEIANAQGQRRVRFEELFLGPGQSMLKHGEELLVGFYLPLGRAGQGSCFKRIMRPQGVALPILNCAIWLERQSDTIKDASIAVGPGGPTPWRAVEAEKALIGKQVGEGTIGTAREALLAGVGFRSSPRRASADYRRHLVKNLFDETLNTAWARTE